MVNFFEKRAQFPKPKKKGQHDSFYIGGDQVKIVGKKVKIPNLGWVRLRECLRYEGKIYGVTISRTADRWFISVSVETHQTLKLCESQASVGVDVGIKTLATFSDGQTTLNPRPLKKRLAKLGKLQRQLSRKQKGSNNRYKAKMRLAKAYAKIADIRQDTLHKLTTQLTSEYLNIAIEDLDISQMVKNKKLAQPILDGGWYEFRRQLEYKAMMRGNRILIADRWFASSKRCSACGAYKDKLTLSERIYNCSHCDLQIDRDLNAALCLKQLFNTASSAEIQACGQEGSEMMLTTSCQPAWKKQELSPV